MENYKEDTEQHGNWLFVGCRENEAIVLRGQVAEPRDRHAQICASLWS